MLKYFTYKIFSPLWRMNIFKAVENKLQPQNNQQAVWLFSFFFFKQLIIHVKLYCLKWHDYSSSWSLGETRHSYRSLLMLVICLSITQLFIHTDKTSQCALCQTLTQSTDVCLCQIQQLLSLSHRLNKQLSMPLTFWLSMVLTCSLAPITEWTQSILQQLSQKHHTQLLRIDSAQHCIGKHVQGKWKAVWRLLGICDKW